MRTTQRTFSAPPPKKARPVLAKSAATALLPGARMFLNRKKKATERLLDEIMQVSPDEQTCLEYLAQGANPKATDSCRIPILVRAAEKDMTDTVLTLIEKGADINVQCNVGSAALICAVGNNNTRLAHALIKKGADVNICNVFGITPLILAAGKGESKTIDLLLAHGAEINQQDTYGRTALMIAAKNGMAVSAFHLAARGADPSIKNEDGNSIHSLADSTLVAGITHIYTTAKADAFRTAAQKGTTQSRKIIHRRKPVTGGKHGR
ncbi:MAG: ankyrin repeat domain-containing protein [Alphaproteobacteria bacterium]|nr:ankyrin repeat domain-containing protein [Alphaproteobacteria bacterium]